MLKFLKSLIPLKSLEIKNGWVQRFVSCFFIMFHSYDYIPLFVSCFDIPVSLGSLFQLVTSIYNRFYLPRLNKLFEKEQIFSLWSCCPKHYFLATSHRSPSPSNQL